MILLHKSFSIQNLPSVQPAPFAKPRLRAFRNAKKEPSAHQKTLNLGYKDSNLEMTESESVALPFGDSPKLTCCISCNDLYYTIGRKIRQALFLYFATRHQHKNYAAKYRIPAISGGMLFHAIYREILLFCSIFVYFLLLFCLLIFLGLSHAVNVPFKRPKPDSP